MSKPCLLLVDDEETNGMILSKLFEHEYEVVGVNSGESALAHERLESVDVVLLDILMPVMDGYEVCLQLRERIASRVPIIFLSATDDMEARLKCYEVGGDDFVCKPFNHRELKMKVSSALSAKQEADDLSQQLGASTSVAMQAMSYSGELGEVIAFYESALECLDLNVLAKCFLQSVQSLGLTAFIALRSPLEIIEHGSNGEITPLESNVLDLLKEQGRIYEFAGRIVFNGKGVSFVVKNMPVDDEPRMGRLRDVLAALLNGLEMSVAEITRYRVSQTHHLQSMQAISESLEEVEHCHRKAGEEAWLG